MNVGAFACAMGSCAVEKLGATDGINEKSTVFKRYEILKSELLHSEQIL